MGLVDFGACRPQCLQWRASRQGCMSVESGCFVQVSKSPPKGDSKTLCNFTTSQTPIITLREGDAHRLYPGTQGQKGDVFGLDKQLYVRKRRCAP